MKQVNFEYRIQMTDETPDDSIWLATSNTDIDEANETIVSVIPRPQACHL